MFKEIGKMLGDLQIENDQLKAELEQEKNWHKTSDEISKANSEYTAKLEAENEKLKKDVERWKMNFNSKVSVIEELIKIIQQAIKDFSIEVGTPQYDRLLENTKALGIGVKDYE